MKNQLVSFSNKGDRTRRTWLTRLKISELKLTELVGEEPSSPVSCLSWAEDGAAFVLGHDDGKVGREHFSWGYKCP